MTKMYFLPALISTYSQGHVLPKDTREESFLSLPSYCWLLAVLSIPRLIAASLRMAKLAGLRLTPKSAIASQNLQYFPLLSTSVSSPVTGMLPRGAVRVKRDHVFLGCVYTPALFQKGFAAPVE